MKLKLIIVFILFLLVGCATTNIAPKEKILPKGYEIVEMNSIYFIKFPSGNISSIKWHSREIAIEYAIWYKNTIDLEK